MSMNAVVEEVEAPSLVLTAQDRCDHGECGAAARARASFEGGFDLIFCLHHVNKNRESLVGKGATIQELPAED